MPTIMSLHGADLGEFGEVVIRDPNVQCDTVHQPWQCSPGLEGLGEGGVVGWLRTQNPIVAGGLVLATSVATGLLLSLGTVWALGKAGYAPDRGLGGTRAKRRRRRR